MTTAIESPSFVMHSPSGKPLELTLIKTTEGVEALGVTSYQGVVTFRDLIDTFAVEANSDAMPVAMKRQRDVDAPRVKGLKRYWETSKGPVFPDMTLFVSQLYNEVSMSGRVVCATIAADADRFICDGQGRTTFIQWLLSQPLDGRYDDYTMSFKLLVTHTDDLQDPKAVEIIKQVFADYHLKKPNKSISKSFDRSNPLTCLVDDLLAVTVGASVTPIDALIARHGKIQRGNLWSYDQFSTMIGKLVNMSATTSKKQLAEQEAYDNTLACCTGFLKQAFGLLPFELLDADDYQAKHEQFMFTKAIFLTALGYVGRSLIDDMLANDDVGFDKLSRISLPLQDKEDAFWVKNRVCMKADNGNKIIKATDRVIANLICRDLYIYPCQALMAA